MLAQPQSIVIYTPADDSGVGRTLPAAVYPHNIQNTMQLGSTNLT